MQIFALMLVALLELIYMSTQNIDVKVLLLRCIMLWKKLLV